MPDFAINPPVPLLSTMIHEFGWTPKLLVEWAQERANGVQYVTPYGVVGCPLRWWENEARLAQR